MKSFSLSVPGNLLLAGEYAVTEEGGLGLTFSPGPRIVLTACVSERWILEGCWPGGGEVFLPGNPSPGLLGAVWKRIFPDGPPSGAGSWSIKVDSGAFFDPQGRKKGFGSSAATAAVAAAALTCLEAPGDLSSGLPDAGVLARKAFLPAVDAHRIFQGGKGSGYDVAASLFGGTGIFTGGQRPRWEPADLTLPRRLHLVSGPEAVRTVSALGSYRAWKQSHPELLQEFVQKNNTLISRLSEKKGFDLSLLLELRELSRNLGKSIGVSAEWSSPESGRTPGWKALGAGNELILLWPNAEGEAALPGDPVQPEKDGLRWEPAEV